MARPVKVITASAEVRAELQRRAKAPTSAHRDRFRANIILLPKAPQSSKKSTAPAPHSTPSRPHELLQGI